MCAKHNTTRQTSKHRQPPLGAPPTRQARSKGRKDRWEARSGASCKATTTDHDQTDPGGDPGHPGQPSGAGRGTVRVPFRPMPTLAEMLRRTALPSRTTDFNDIDDPEVFHPFAKLALQQAPKRPTSNIQHWHICTDGSHQADSAIAPRTHGHWYYSLRTTKASPSKEL